ncbi:MAG: methyltransferase domain-containing protein [Dehalococcoidia bacterium]|nr:methyltransferase domain-containing protein [Dehalococcoidia bacterium]
MPSRFPRESFSREDESPDAEFYAEPRLVTHIDEYAIEAVGEAYRRFLPPDGEYLDIMSSWVSHYPADLPVRRVVGLGMNELELSKNPLLAEYTVQDLNQDSKLPYEDGRFDGATLCVSVQYLTHPEEVFAEIGRALKPGAPLVVTFSNRCFPMKAVRMWVNASSRQRSRIIATYMEDSGRFDVPEVYDLSPALYYYGVPEDPELRHRISVGEVQTDPLHAVVGRTRLFFY